VPSRSHYVKGSAMSENSATSAGQHRAAHRGRGPLGWSRGIQIVSAIVGALLVGGASYAVSLWVVGLGAGSNGQAQSAGVSNLTITAVTAPAPTNLLYPGASGDVVAKIANPNSFPVTITAVSLPANTSFAGGFSDPGLTTPQAGCTTTLSNVGWTFATGTGGSTHTLTTPITVAAAGNLTMTFTNAASMGMTAPAACESTYFSMPSLTGVVATGGAATATVGTTDGWTS
jgi:hypothetical protein